MTSATIAPLRGTQPATSTTVRQGPIIVATDGSLVCDAAFSAARRLSALSTSNVVVLSVVEPVAVFPMESGIAFPMADLAAAQREVRLKKVMAQLERVGVRDARWTVEVGYGDPAQSIAATAHEMDATVVIAGTGHHELIDRMLGSETTLRTVRASKGPVLVVTNQFAALPKRAIVATDFSVASLDSARAALRLFPGISVVYLVHVLSRLEVPPDVFVTWAGLYTEPIPRSFERVTAALDLPPSITVETITLEGKVAHEIVKFARSAGADLIVTGSRGAGLMSRLLVGSTATGIIRGANCAVLAVPAAPGSERMIGFDDEVPESEDRWADELSVFTKRNAGRRTTLEVDDPACGALIQEHGYPLLGVAYDRHDRRVEIMLGDLEGAQRHLTRGIADVSSVDILRDAWGRDRVLRVAHGEGQTLLTLEN